MTPIIAFQAGLFAALIIRGDPLALIILTGIVLGVLVAEALDL